MVLLTNDQEVEVRNAIASLRGGAGASATSARVGGLVLPRALQDLLEVVWPRAEQDFGLKAAIVGSYWPQGVNRAIRN